jgi:hypothetical protein
MHKKTGKVCSGLITQLELNNIYSTIKSFLKYHRIFLFYVRVWHKFVHSDEIGNKMSILRIVEAVFKIKE